jgi:acid phosphatase
MLIFTLLAASASAAVIGVVEVCRHGARAPIDFYPWDQGYWNEGMGELTQEGMRMQFLAGAEFRSRYIQQQGLFPDVYNASYVYVRSTDVNRTIMSAQSQLMGFFPNGPSLTSAEMAQRAIPPFNNSNFNNVIPGLGLSALPNGFQPVPVHVVAQPYDNMLYGYSGNTCPYMNIISQQVQQSSYYQFLVTNYTNYLQKQLYQVFGQMVSFEYAGWYGDVLLCDQFHGYPWPDGITNEMFNQMIGIMNYSNSYFFQTPGAQLASSEFYAEMLSTFNGLMNGTSTQKWSFYSAHDTTLVGFLTAIGNFNGNNPPFASTLVFTLEQEGNLFFVNTTYNDVQLLVPGCSALLCPFNEFQNSLNSWIISDVVAACQAPAGFDEAKLAYNPFMNRIR